MHADYDYLFKFILVGESSIQYLNSDVGKSCLLLRFLQSRFKGKHEPTLGVQFGAKLCPIDGQNIRIQVWDTAGQQSFRSITRAYYKGSIAALLVFDLTSSTSFEALGYWLKELRSNSHSKLHLCVIGTKSDLKSERQVSEAVIEQFLENNGIENYFETSALSGENCQRPFLELGQQIVKAIGQGKIVVEEDWALGVKPNPKPKSASKPTSKPTTALQSKEKASGSAKAEQKCHC